jgi:hypothetical protein
MKKVVYLLAITLGLSFIGCTNSTTKPKEEVADTTKTEVVVDTAKKVTIDTTVKVTNKQEKK